MSDTPQSEMEIIAHLANHAKQPAPTHGGFEMISMEGEISVQQSVGGYELYWRQFTGEKRKGRLVIADGSPLFIAAQKMDVALRPRFEKEMAELAEFRKFLAT